MKDKESRAHAQNADRPPENNREVTKPGLNDMSFLEHLEELRGTLIRCLITLFIACLFVMGFLKYFANLLNWPLHFVLGENAEEGLITTSPMAVFSVILQISFLGRVCPGIASHPVFCCAFHCSRFDKKRITHPQTGVCARPCFIYHRRFIQLLCPRPSIP